MIPTVTCGSCGTEQPGDARFCSACGAALVRVCPSCGTESPADAAFCATCGTPLHEGTPRGPAVDDHEERRVVTVLFADLAGSTALGSRVDPEELRVIQLSLIHI